MVRDDQDIHSQFNLEAEEKGLPDARGEKELGVTKPDDHSYYVNQARQVWKKGYKYGILLYGLQVPGSP